MSKLIPLTQGKFAIVDDEDFEWISKLKWCAMKWKRGWYAGRSVWLGGKYYCYLMHRVIACQPSGIMVDHHNFDSLDNRKINLRPASRAENTQHQRMRLNSLSGFKGVSISNNTKTTPPRWKAQIRVSGKYIYLGCFADKTEAARAYDIAAKTLHGEFAGLNFPCE